MDTDIPEAADKDGTHGEQLQTEIEDDKSHSFDETKIDREKQTRADEKEKFLVDNFQYKISTGFLQSSNIFVELEEVRFHEQIKVDFICDFCHLFLWRPVSLDCGHVLCLDCLKLDVEKTTCPVDLQVYEGTKIEINASLEAEISELMIKCVEPKCSWIGKCSELGVHFSQCTFKKVDCPHCFESITVCELEEHDKFLCEQRRILCQYCNTSILYNTVEDHEKSCYEKPIPCPNQCKTETESKECTVLKQGELEKHLQTLCPDRKLLCQFSDFNCGKNVKFRKMGIHLIKNALIHLDTLCEASHKSRDVLESQVKMMIKLREKIVENDKRISDLQLRSGPQLIYKIVDVQEKYQAAVKTKTNELFSSHFYSTSPYGYKLVLRVMLNGSSVVSTGRYISVFISICDNGHNNLLVWPFAQKVTVYLINQVSKEHISYTIVPNAIKENFDFLKKPDTERNPYFGIDKFVPCSVLEGETEYVVENTMYWKVNIEPCNVA